LALVLKTFHDFHASILASLSHASTLALFGAFTGEVAADAAVFFELGLLAFAAGDAEAFLAFAMADDVQ